MPLTRSLSWLLGAWLAGCSPSPGPDGGDATPSDAAQDAPASPDDVHVVPRCGPSAVAFPTDAGACAVEAPLPDGGAPPPGQCAPTVGGPAALLAANQTDGDAVVLPSGRRARRAAVRRGLSGFPMSVLRIPGTSLLVVSDGGLNTERLRVIDTASPTLAVAPGGDVSFPRAGGRRDPALFYGLAFDPTTRTLYASGGGGNRIYAYDVAASGALAANPGRTIDLGITEVDTEGTAMGALRTGYVAGLALADDGTQIYAALQRGHALGIYSTMTRAMLRVVPFASVGDAAAYPHAVVRRPGDARRVYVSLWGSRQVAEVDVVLGAVTRTFDVGKNPEEMVFSPDGARLYVAASDSDAINVIDLAMPSAPVRTSYLGGSTAAARGVSPTALAWGPMDRLYVVEADENAVDVLDGATLARVGRIPTEWYPTDLDVAPDGAVTVVTGKGVGSGANNAPTTAEINELMSGSVARYGPVDDATLRAGDAAAAALNAVRRGFNDVACPAGAPYDFPVPRVGSGAASTRIRHVVFVVRENKTYDALLGDYEGAPGNRPDGDPALTFVPRPQMPEVFPNLRALAQRFASHDNYYSNAEQSIQGHVWTTQGRTTDYTERSWLSTWGRATRTTPNQGIAPVGLPEEGSIFHAMARAGVRAENWGEIVGGASAAQSVGGRYPGLFYNMGVADMRKARAFGDWVLGTNAVGTNPQRACQLPSFTYIILPNDHTAGARPGVPTPVSYLQDNDEATGYLVDAVSHSRFWPETLVVVIEDDPSQGGDHVDNHRSIALLISPWVRRGYTSHVHYDESSLHHTIELILGVPPHNEAIAGAAPMYDAFTGTPDFAPYRYAPRRACEALNPARGLHAEESLRMDFTRPDNAPGLSRMLWRITHGEQEPPWTDTGFEPDDDDD